MKNFQLFWAETVIKHRIFCIFLMLSLILISIFSIIKFPLKYDNSFEMFMLEDDPNIVTFETFRELFGDAEYLSVGVSAREEDPDVFIAKTIKVIHEISTFLENHEHVTKVSSLSNYQHTHDNNGIMSTENLFEEPEELKKNNSVLKQARDIMSGEVLVHDRLLSKNFQHTRILARTEYIRNENSHKVKVSTDLYDFLEKQGYDLDGYKIRLGGGAIISERFEYLSKRDSSILNPIVAIIMCGIIYLLFGSILVCFLPWFLIGTSIALVTGIQAWLKFPNTVVNGALTPTLMIIGMGVSIHVLSEFFRQIRVIQCSKQAAGLTIQNLLKPIFFTALTTSIGFSALAVTNLIPVKQYAFLAAIGSLVIFIVSMTLFVSVLSFLKIHVDERNESRSTNLIVHFTKIIPNFVSNYKISITVIAFLLVLFCALTVPRITADSNIFNYFKSNNWIHQDMEYFDDLYKFSGIELIVDSEKTDGIKDPNFLRRVASLESYLNKLENTGKVTSIIEFLKQLQKALNYGDPAFYQLPDSSAMTAQLLLMYANSGPEDDLSDSIDFDSRYLRLSLPLKNSSAKEFKHFYESLKGQIAEEFPKLKIIYTGPMVLYNAQEMYINSGLKQSFALALLMVGLSFFVLFGSIKFGVIALFPSVLPILVVGGLTIFMGISLDLGTIIIGAMCMGIAVDDAIHVMERYIRHKNSGLSKQHSIELAIQESGKAVIFTSFILIFGFSAMLFASLVPTMLFGIFVALIMALALLGDLFVLPALLLIFDKDSF